MIRRLQAKRWVILGWQNVKKVAHRVTQPEDITESTQQEEKYSFYSKYTQYVNFITEFDSHHKYAFSLHGFLSTVAIFHFWNWNILLPQLQSTSSHSSQINKSVQSAKNKFYAMFMVCKGARMNTVSYSLYVHNYELRSAYREGVSCLQRSNLSVTLKIETCGSQGVVTFETYVSNFLA